MMTILTNIAPFPPDVELLEVLARATGEVARFIAEVFAQ